MEVEKQSTVVRDKPDEPFVVVARAVKLKGLKGEIVAELLTDFPDRFNQIDQFFAISPKRERIAVKLERFSFQKDRVVLKLAGYESIESAGTLIGYEFVVPEAERVELADDEFYDWELEGSRVETIAGQPVGLVTGVLRTGGANLLIVARETASETLIPMVSSILVRIDKERKLIVIDPPEGLLEL